MTGYDRVIDALGENGLCWSEVDRIMLREDAYDEFHRRAGFDPANYATTDKPAVRYTEGEEKIVYVNEQGYEVEIIL